MNKNQTQSDWLDLIKQYGGWIIAAIGFLTGLINFIILVQGNTKLIVAVFSVSGVLLLWASFFYIRFWKTDYRLVTASKSDTPLKRYAYSKKARRFAFIGIFTVPLLVAGSITLWQYFKHAPDGKITILVADFHSLDNNNYGVTEQIIEQLRHATKDYSEVRIEPLNKAITAKEGSDLARSIGRDQNAAIVLWGWYRSPQVTVHFELLREKPHNISMHQEQQIVSAGAVGLDQSFELQTRISNEMSYLTLLIVGLIRLEMQDYDGAIERISKALSQTDVPEQMIDPSKIYLYRGDAYLEKGNYDSAIADYTTSINIAPNNATAYLNRATAYYFKGQQQVAIPDIELAIKYLNDFATANSQLPEVYFNRGIAYSMLGNHDRAIADYSEAIRLKPDFVFAYDNRAGEYEKKGEYDKAIADLNYSINLKPNSSTAYYGRGIIYFLKRDYERAISDYSRAIKLNPNYAFAYDNRGVAYAMKNDYYRAIADYTQAIKINPNLHIAYLNRGSSYSDLGDFEPAIADFNQAIKIKPDYAEAYLNRGMAYDKNGDPRRAIDDYSLAMKFKQNYYKAYNNRGIAYSHLEDYDSAIADFSQAIKLNPTSAAAFSNRARAYKKKGDNTRALLDSQEASKLEAQGLE